MKRFFIVTVLWMATALALSAGELEEVTLSDGTVLYGRVVETGATGIHLVSSRLNRTIPFEHMSEESREKFKSPARSGAGSLDETRRKLVESYAASGTPSPLALRPRIALAPVVYGYGYGTFYGWPAGYHPGSHCRRAPTLSVRIDL